MFSLIQVHLITQNHLLIQIQYHNHTQIEIQTLSKRHSHPVVLIGLEVKLEGQVLCGALVCNSHSPTPNHDLYERGISSDQGGAECRQIVGTFYMLFKTVVIRKQTHQRFLLLSFPFGCTS